MATPAVVRFLVRPAGLLSAAAIVCGLTVGGVVLSRPSHTDVSLDDLASSAAATSAPSRVTSAPRASTTTSTAGVARPTSGTVLLPGASAPANALAVDRTSTSPDAPGSSATTSPAGGGGGGGDGAVPAGPNPGDGGANGGGTGPGPGGEANPVNEQSPTTTSRPARPGRLLASDGSVVITLSAEGAEEHAVVQGTSPVWHPDGRRAAFVFEGAIWLIDVDNPVAPALLVKSASGPAWSPDGSRLAFVRTIGGKDQVWQANGDGTNPRQLVRPDSGLGSSRSPSWAPDGTTVAFAFGDSGATPGGIATIDANTPGSRPAVVANDGGLCCDNRAPAWSPDGASLAWLFTSATGTNVRIVHLADRAISDVVTGATSAPAWAPDGLELVVQAPDGLHAASPDGAANRLIPTSATFDNGRPSWH